MNLPGNTALIIHILCPTWMSSKHLASFGRFHRKSASSEVMVMGFQIVLQFFNSGNIYLYDSDHALKVLNRVMEENK